ncbi:rRNA adenine N-6-methyltransferase family protein [Fictibacillus barbaricus]|uniref:SAM-dependent methyltransferase n=1 Tax=Fictibacillus barbaricus TaxID=182136 RepID=A0ABU1TVT4_9BACL|nr:rRNA adenine N-6-methyltransferase family protein [Fictibacillus barbaricus]MDR7071325.1 SAM-dependent methyltransferase [Fictibacillus barbaricus]
MSSLKQSFNNVASSYEKYRPSYPNEMFTHIFNYANLNKNDSLLEIGCGTGKATEGFLNHGYEHITCIEYGDKLAQLTKEKFSSYSNVQVIHLKIGNLTKISTHLLFPGLLFILWFVHIPSKEPVYEDINLLYKKYAPYLDDRDVPALEKEIEERSRLTMESGHFHQLKVHTYHWEQTYKPEEYIGLLNTHSGHQVLQEEQKQALYQGIEKAILNHGGYITKQHAVALYLARKK